MRRSATGDRDLGGCIIFGHPAPRRNAETMPAIGSGAGLREQNRTGSTGKSIERARVMCEWRESCGAGTVRRLLSPFDPTPHRTQPICTL